jgi:competence protein ComFC
MPDRQFGRGFLAPVRGLGGILLNLFYPPHCALCGCRIEAEAKGECSVFCEPCRASIMPPPEHHCPVCSHPMAGLMLCPNCDGRHWHLETIVTACRYEGGVREMIQRFKYGRDIAMARSLGILLLRALSDVRLSGRSFDAVVPVPLHPQRERERGFNQADLLARVLARSMGLPKHDLLKRIRPTAQQAGFDRSHRMENLRGAFVLRRPLPPDATLLLVDDVSTTGSTLDACAAVLKEAGAAEIAAVVVARG